MQRINYCWRLVAKGLSFFVFGIGSLLLGLVIVPLITLLVRDRSKSLRWSRRLVGGGMGLFVWFMQVLGLLEFTVTGMDKADADKGYLIVANHPSLIDVAFLLSLFPMSECAIKPGLQRNPFTRHLMHGVDYLSDRDPVEWMDACVQRLQQGRSLILFPEGTRSEPDRPMDFKAGAAAIALRSGVECLPVVISMHPPSLMKSEPWYRVGERASSYLIAVQDPIDPQRVIEGQTAGRQNSRVFNRYLHGYFCQQLERLNRSVDAPPI
ncbi:MAG: lysophospholipid acyltransferase family protein [Gammaproteobacteria bacterium]